VRFNYTMRLHINQKADVACDFNSGVKLKTSQGHNSDVHCKSDISEAAQDTYVTVQHGTKRSDMGRRVARI